MNSINNPINWNQIIATVVISSFTSIVVIQIQSWLTNRKEKRKSILGTLEFFRAIIDSDRDLLSNFINLIKQNIDTDPGKINLMPIFKLNLNYSITDYVNFFKINTLLAEHVINHLYLRENLIDISIKNGLDLKRIILFTNTSSDLLKEIEEIIELVKESKLSRLKKRLKKLKPKFLIKNKNYKL